MITSPSVTQVLISIQPFNSWKQLKCNFSLLHVYPNIIQQTGNANTQTYWVEIVMILI